MFYELTSVVGGAQTSVVVDSIDAGCSVLTVMVFTVVSVSLTSGALKAQGTLTAVVEYNHPVISRIERLVGFQSSSSSHVLPLLLLIHSTGSSVGTRVTHAGVQSCLTVLALGPTTEYLICKSFHSEAGCGDSSNRSYLKPWWTAAPVDLHQVAVTDALVEAGTGQAGVTLG